jgi:N6-L-threonylcarbamoyladenine synthase
VLCLGIETSCDETALALVDGGKLIGENIASQIKVHSIFGGIVPEIASREHLRTLAPLFDDLLLKCNVEAKDIQIIAVTRGPGLLGSLLVGLGFAKGLSLALKRPLVGVNHLYAHLLVVGLEQAIEFPSLGLLVSGGHTHIYFIRSPFEFELLGKTLDDAAGEAFDKVARFLNLPYPGGGYIDRFAQMAEPDPDLFPRPYIDNDNLDFSFSGLKTAVANFLKKNEYLVFKSMDEVATGFTPEFELAKVCASFNWAVAQTLKIKLNRALKRVRPKSIILAGGVAANTLIRKTIEALCQAENLPLLLPAKELCTDNAAMIAYYGELLGEAGLRHGLDLEAIPRGRKIPRDYVKG